MAEEIQDELRETMRNIERHLRGSGESKEDLAKHMKKIADSLQPGGNKKYLKDLEKSFSRASQSTETFSRRTQSASDAASTLENEFGIVSESTGQFGSHIKGAGSAVLGFSESVHDMRMSMGGLTQVLSNLPLVGGTFAMFTGLAYVLDDSIEHYRTMTRSMVRFEGGLIEAQMRAGEMGIAFEEFAEITTKYAGVINRLGIDSFSTLVREVKTSSSLMANLGLTVSDTSEYLAQYLERERLLGSLRQVNDQEMNQQFQQAMTYSAEVAAMTGKGLQDVFDQFTQQAQDPRFANALRILPDQAEQAATALATIAPELKGGLLTFLEKGTAMHDEEFAKLVPTGVADELEGLFGDIEAGRVDQREVALRFKEIMQAVSPEQIRHFSFFEDGTLEMISSMQTAADAINAEAMDISEMNRETDTALLEFNEMLSTLARTIKVEVLEGLFGELGSDEFKENLDYFRETLKGLGDSIVNLLFGELGSDENRMDQLREKIDWVTDGFRAMLHGGIEGFIDVLEWFKDPENRQRILNALDDVTGAITAVAGAVAGMTSWFSENGLLGEALIGGITALFLGPAIVSALAGAIGKLFLGRAALGAVTSGVSSLLGSGGRAAGDAAGTAGRGLGRAGGALKSLGRAAGRFGPLAAIMSAVDLGGTLLDRSMGNITGDEATAEMSATGGGLAGSLSGAAAGAAMGSVVPGIGTAIGGLVGGTVGYFGGRETGKFLANIMGFESVDDIDEARSEAEQIKEKLKGMEPGDSGGWLGKSYETLKKDLEILEERFPDLTKAMPADDGPMEDQGLPKATPADDGSMEPMGTRAESEVISSLQSRIDSQANTIEELRKEISEVKSKSDTPALTTTVDENQARHMRMMEELNRNLGAMNQILNDIRKESRRGNQILSDQ